MGGPCVVGLQDSPRDEKEDCLQDEAADQRPTLNLSALRRDMSGNEPRNGETHVRVELVEAIMTLDQLVERPKLRLEPRKIPLWFRNSCVVVKDINCHRANGPQGEASRKGRKRHI